MMPRPVPETRRPAIWLYAETLLMVAGVTAAGLAAADIIPASAMDLAYLLPVLAAASLYGLRFALFASLASALAYNFFYTAPLHTLRIDDPENVVTVLVLLGVALFTSRLMARIQDEAATAAAQARQNAVLAGFTGQLVAAGDTVSIATVLCREVAALFGVNTVFLTGAPLQVVSSVPPLAMLGGIDRDAAEYAASTQHLTGRHSDALPAADWQFHPLHGGSAVLGLARDDGRLPVDPEDRRLLESLLAQTTLALAREALAGEMRGLDQLRERDRLRGALLSSVGHDLRTPLTAIFAATAELAQHRDNKSLTDTLAAAAHRLDRYIANLLDMTRIEAGAIKLHIEATDLTDAVAAAVREMAPAQLGLAVAVDLPLVRVDPQLLHHCLINLLDNAGKYGDGVIEVEAAMEGDTLRLSVCDRGPGLPPGSERRVFETFTRLEGSDRQQGTGLGLSIVKGFAEAMGVAVVAHNRTGGGASFDLRFPRALLVSLGEPI